MLLKTWSLGVYFSFMDPRIWFEVLELGRSIGFSHLLRSSCCCYDYFKVKIEGVVKL